MIIFCSFLGVWGQPYFSKSTNRLEKREQFEGFAHPLSCWNKFLSVSYADLPMQSSGATLKLLSPAESE
jgi:hypothetical protein